MIHQSNLCWRIKIESNNRSKQVEFIVMCEKASTLKLVESVTTKWSVDWAWVLKPCKLLSTKSLLPLVFIWSSKDVGGSHCSPIRPICEIWPAFSEPSGISNSLKGGAGDCLKGGLPSLVSQFSLTCHLVSCVASPDNCPPIWRLCHGCMVELRQRRSSWTWTSTTRGITVSSPRTDVGGGWMPFLLTFNTVDVNWGRKGG